jgi:hypothetical protein
MSTDRANAATSTGPHRPPVLLPASPLAGTAMLLGAACLAVAETVHVQVGGEWSVEAMLQSLADRPQRWLLWSLLLMAMALLLLPGVAVWRTRVAQSGRRRGRGLTTVGSVVLGAALVALFGFGASHAQGVAAVAGTSPVPPDVVAAFTRMDSSLGTGLEAGLALLGFHVGVPLLLCGLARAAVLPWSVAVVGSVAAVAAFVVGGLGWYVVVTTFLITAGVLAYLGLLLLRPFEATAEEGVPASST